MRSARCPVCQRQKIVNVVPGSKGSLARIRTHHQPYETNLLERMKAPLCQGSRKLVEIERTREVPSTPAPAA